MAVQQSEKRRVEESQARSEQSIKELQKDKQSLTARAEAAEARVKDVLAMRDAVVEERSRALENLASVSAEKSGCEELVRRCELQIRTLTDDKAAMGQRAEGAEARCKELHSRGRRAVGALQAHRTVRCCHTERRAVEEVLRLTEVRMGEERPPLISRAEFAEKRCNEMESQRDSLSKERQSLLDQLSQSKDQHADCQKELASSVAERRALEELLQRTEQRLGDERASLRSSADGAEARCAEIVRQRDGAVDERIKAAEAMAAAEADRRSAEDAALRVTGEMKRLGEERTSLLDRLGATDERNRELSLQLEKAQEQLAEFQQEKSSLQREKTALSQNLAVTQTELRGKEVVARHAETRLHEEKLALQARCEAAEERCHEINSRRDALQADRARLQDSYNHLLEERNRLEEKLGNINAEKRGLEELALYVNAITRSGGGPKKDVEDISASNGGVVGRAYSPQGVLDPNLASSTPFASAIASAAQAPSRHMTHPGMGGGGLPPSGGLPTRSSFDATPRMPSQLDPRYARASSTPTTGRDPNPPGPASVSWAAPDVGPMTSSVAAARSSRRSAAPARRRSS